MSTLKRVTRVSTPWGFSQSTDEIAPGITFYSTPSHGGFLLSNERREEMPSATRQFQTWAGANWYEEDFDAFLVVHSFPSYFPADDVTMARRVIGARKPWLLK